MPMNRFLFPHCFDTNHTRAGKQSTKSDTSKHWHVFIGMKLSSISRSVLSVVYLARALSLGAAIDYLFREIKHRQMYEEVRLTAQNQFATPFYSRLWQISRPWRLLTRPQMFIRLWIFNPLDIRSLSTIVIFARQGAVFEHMCEVATIMKSHLFTDYQHFAKYSRSYSRKKSKCKI